MTDLVYIDVESRSSVPIKHGIDAYWASPDAQLILVQWALNNGPVRVWEPLRHPQPKELTDVLYRPHRCFVAHNAAFDRHGLARKLLLDTPPSEWSCTRAQANAHSLPGGLEALGEALGIPADYAKIKDGKRLIQLFCVPHSGRFTQPEDAPDDWQAFINYGMRDIDALRAIHRRLPTHNFTGSNLRYYWLDAAANERGFAVDLPLVDATVGMLERAKRKGDTNVAARTGNAVTAITQRDKLLRYLQQKFASGLEKLTRDKIEKELQRDDLDPEERFLLEARLEGARASGAKYKAALRSHVGGRIRYSMQFSGAGATGRDAHKGFQPGNMPRAVTFNPLAERLSDQHVPASAEFIDDCVLPAIHDGSAADPMLCGGPNTAAALACRHTIIAEKGNELIVADFKNIESVVLAWIAGAEAELKDFRRAFAGEKIDAYRLLYHRFFGKAVERISDHERQVGKVVKLLCGFGGSVGGIASCAVGYGIDLKTLPPLILPNATEKQLAKADQVWTRAFLTRADYDLEPDVFKACHVLVQMFRSANPEVDAVKKHLGRAVEHAIRLRGSLHEAGRCKIWCNADVLIIELPSSRRLYYWNPEIKTETIYDPEDGLSEERSYTTYLRWRGKQMLRERAWHGLFLENVVQAIANDCLRFGCIEIDNRWPGSLVLKIHDEAVAEAPKGAIALKDFYAALCKGWSWSAGLPLAASGWVGPRYGKR